MRVDIALAAHKVSLLIQYELGGIEWPSNEQFVKHKLSFQQDKSIVWQHVNRLIRCIIDCLLHLQDAVGARNALELARSLSAGVWDNSPLQLKQVEQVGIVSVRKLVNAGIASIEALEATEPHRIQTILSKNPPFGYRLLEKLNDFPKLRVSVKMIGKEVKNGKGVTIKVNAEIGFLNEKAPLKFNRRPVHVCFLAETSDGRLVDFRRMTTTQVEKVQKISLSVDLTNADQIVLCHVMCDEIAGTTRYAELRPKLPATLFPSPKLDHSVDKQRPAMNVSRRRSEKSDGRSRSTALETDEFGGDVDDGDLLAVADELDFQPIDAYDSDDEAIDVLTGRGISKKAKLVKAASTAAQIHEDAEPAVVPNGKYACNHRCSNKGQCKHLCCREGLDKPPKASRKKVNSTEENAPKSTVNKAAADKKRQQLLIHPADSRPQRGIEDVETVNLIGPSSPPQRPEHASRKLPQAYQGLDALHSKTTKDVSIGRLSGKGSSSGRQQTLSFLATPDKDIFKDAFSDYNDGWDFDEDLPSTSSLLKHRPDQNDFTTARSLLSGAPVEETHDADDSHNRISEEDHNRRDSYGDESPFPGGLPSVDPFDDEDMFSLEAGMVGVDDSMVLQDTSQNNENSGSAATQAQPSVSNIHIENTNNWSSSPKKHLTDLQKTPSIWQQGHDDFPSNAHQHSDIFMTDDSKEHCPNRHGDTTKPLKRQHDSVVLERLPLSKRSKAAPSKEDEGNSGSLSSQAPPTTISEEKRREDEDPFSGLDDQARDIMKQFDGIINWI